MTKPTFKKRLARRISKKTNYRKRKALLLSGKPRLVIRKTNKHIIIQFIDFALKGDKTITEFNSKKLEKIGLKGKNRMMAYLAGYAAGLNASKKGVKTAVLDLGMQTAHKKGKLFSALKGVLKTGIEIPHKPAVLPEEKMIGEQEQLKKYENKIEKNFR